ncbi:MAG: hypothetical protein AAB907_00275, partial [Patescibacteria group bacterium]
MSAEVKLLIPDKFKSKHTSEDYVHSPAVIAIQTYNLLSLYKNGVLNKEAFDPAREYFVAFSIKYMRGAQVGLYARAGDFFPTSVPMPDDVRQKSSQSIGIVTSREREVFSHAQQVLNSIPEVVNTVIPDDPRTWKLITKPKTLDQFNNRFQEMVHVLHAIIAGGPNPKQEIISSQGFFRTLAFFKAASEFSVRNAEGDRKINEQEERDEEERVVASVVDHMRHFRTMDELDAGLNAEMFISIQGVLDANRKPDPMQQALEEESNRVLSEDVKAHLKRYRTGAGFERAMSRKRFKELVKEIDIFLEDEKRPKISVRLNEPFSIVPNFDGRIENTRGYLNTPPQELLIPELNTTGRILIRKRKDIHLGPRERMPLGKPGLKIIKKG